MAINLTVHIGKLKLKNPVMVASGTFGPEYGELIEMNSLGAIVLKTITLEPRLGNPPPRVAETASGMINSIGLENKGIDDFINNKIPKLVGVKTPIIASIAGDSEKDYAELAKRLSKVSKVSALELNLSCPNVKHGAREGLIAQDADATRSIISAVRRVTRLTLIAKLTPNVADITKIAMAAQEGGADAIALVNTFPSMAVDVDTMKPKLGHITGGLSGPAIKPIALKMVWDTYNEIDIPIVGLGGIMDSNDAVEFMLCGAQAIQVGTANFVNPHAPLEIIEGLKKYLRQKGCGDVNELVGSMKAGPL